MTLYYLSDTVFFARQFPPACLCEGSRTPAARCEQAKSRLYIIKKNHRQGNALFAKQKLTEKKPVQGRRFRARPCTGLSIPFSIVSIGQVFSG